MGDRVGIPGTEELFGFFFLALIFAGVAYLPSHSNLTREKGLSLFGLISYLLRLNPKAPMKILLLHSKTFRLRPARNDPNAKYPAVFARS